MKSVILALAVIFFQAWPAANQSVNFSDTIWKQGKSALANGNVAEALRIWKSAKESNSEIKPDPRIGFNYIKLVTSEKLSSYYSDASDMVYWGLSGKCSQNHRDEISSELERVRPIINPDSYSAWKGYLKNDIATLCSIMSKFWKQMDPVLSTEYNERLIEHWERIAYARSHFNRNTTTVYGTDDRALVYVKLGEPDYRRENTMRYNRAQVRSWVMDAMNFPGSSVGGGGSSSGDSLSRAGATGGDRRPSISQNMIQDRARIDRADRFSREAEQLHRIRDYEIWIYLRDEIGNVEEYDKNLVYIFGEHGDTGFYGKLRSLEDMIPDAAFRNKGGQGAALSPAYLLQLLFYQQVITVDDYFANAFYDLESRLTTLNGLNTMAAFSARSKNINELNYIQVHAPKQKSTFENEKRAFDLDVYQYRLLGDNNQPYLATYLEGQPQRALVFNQVKEKRYGADDFSLTFFNKSFNADYNVIHRDQKAASIYLQGRGDVEEMEPSRTYMQIPNFEQEITQLFTAELRMNEKSVSDTINVSDSNLISAYGKSENRQPQPLNTDPNSLEMSDIIVGSNVSPFETYSDSPVKFKVSHNKRIHANNNLMIHFEIYHLQAGSGSQNPASFEVQYKVRPKNRNFFQRLFKKSNKTGLTLNFETSDLNYKADLEIVTSSFDPGNYVLELKAYEHATGREVSRQIEFEILD